jgi:hypothetical protein
MGQHKGPSERRNRSSNSCSVQRQTTGSTPGKRSLVDQVYGQGNSPLAQAATGAPSVQAKALQLQPAPTTPPPAAHPFKAKLEDFKARRGAIRKQLDTKQTTPLTFTTTVVGIYSNDVFKNWEPWRKDAEAIGDKASALKTEIMNSLVDAKLDLDKPDEKQMEDEALSVAEQAGFVFIDATRTLLPSTSIVTVIERVDGVVFTTTATYTMDLQTWLDQVKSDYEAASKAKAAGSSAAPSPDGTTGSSTVDSPAPMATTSAPSGDRTPVQLAAAGGWSGPADPARIADAGVVGPAHKLPHLDTIQRAFGRFDVSGVEAHSGPQAQSATQALNAAAYATGNKVAFDSSSPSLHTAAHEAAHVVQQRGGVSLRADGVGEQGDAYEQHADRVADAVVRGESAEALLEGGAGRGGASPAGVQRKERSEVPRDKAEEDDKKEESTGDIDAILRAGKKEREEKPDATMTMIRGASIGYRILRTFLPEVYKTFWVSGVGGKPNGTGIKLIREGEKSVSMEVGRDFILACDEAHLQDRVAEVSGAFQAIAVSNKGAGSSSAVNNSKPIDYVEAVREGGTLFASKAGFGLTAGNKDGADAADGYDARYWSESGRSITAIVEPYLAMDQMVQHLGELVPTKDGRMTKWHFDCFEGMDVVRKYAEWRTSSREEFNKKNSPLRLGFMSYLFDGSAKDLEQPIHTDGKHGKPYTLGEEKAKVVGGTVTFEREKVPVGKTIDELLAAAPPGSWICFTNADVTARLAKHAKDVAAGKQIKPEDQELIDRITPWNNENALKLGPDQYSAFPFGIVDGNTIKRGMAEIVFRPNAVPSGYIEKNIYISVIANRKP